MGIVNSKDRELLKKRIKELKAATEKEKKQQEKERKAKEKEQKKQQKKKWAVYRMEIYRTKTCCWLTLVSLAFPELLPCSELGNYHL